MKKASMFRCRLCSRLTLHHCAYCKEPICQHCQTVSHGKTYCSPQHRDRDSRIGRFLHTFEQSLR